jgi:hypothetical protein
MNKKSKEIIYYAVVGIVIFIVPQLLFNYFQDRNREMFRRHVTEDYETCRQRAESDSLGKDWCGEIRNAATLAYSNSTSANNLSTFMLMFQPLFFVLLVSVYHLRKQVDDLKAKTDV